VALDGLIHAFTLDREGPRVIVCHAVNQQNRMLDIVSEHKGRDIHIHLASLPERTALALEAKRGQGSIVSSATRHTGAEQVRMGQQVSGHESAITVPAYPDAVGVGHAQFYGLINSRFGA